MKKLHFTIQIDAPRQLVWDTMLQPETYTLWTAGFCEGSRYEGSWEKGASILFLGPDGEGMKAVTIRVNDVEGVGARLPLRQVAAGIGGVGVELQGRERQFLRVRHA